MKKNLLNYRILVEKEKTKKGYVYVSYVPSLGISDFGKDVDEAVKNTEKAIKIYLETLVELKNDIPKVDAEEYFVVNKQIEFNTPIAVV
mgnify:CR=1 FL=1